jgi:hypothetical protein
MKWTPAQQQELFFRWFAKIGIHHFDVQLREPVPETKTAPASWRWLKPSLGISTGAFFLKYSSWVKFMNAKGGDIYIRPHGDSEHAVIFLDDLPMDKALQVSQKYAACVVCTSKDNTQVWLATDKVLSKAERKDAQVWMKGVGYTDPGSISGDHLGRLCGFRSQKRQCWVNLVTTTLGKKYPPTFVTLVDTVSPPLLGGERVSFSSPSQTDDRPKGTQAQKPQSQSERDFGWAMGAMKNGMLYSDVIDALAASAKKRKKANPVGYAERTAAAIHHMLKLKY